MNRTQEVARRRAGYQRELALGTDRFHAPKRTTCPWCGSSRLRTRLRTVDLLQHKPGTFVVDQCGDCSHSFQNPRLTPEGLDFYYRDYYDGLGVAHADWLFGPWGSRKRYLASARALLPFGAPRRWLDVGTGHGHFPGAARTVHPGTVFDGLDRSAGVEEARRRGRIAEAYRGGLTELAPELEGRYDVVSMFHYLEHSIDPRAELAAAKALLAPGGRLIIEVPDPECAMSRVLGRWWIPYLQPQHLHLFPFANLRRELESLGFTVVAVERHEPHTAVDLTCAAALALGHVLPPADEPWHAHPPTAPRRMAREALFWSAFPLLAGVYGLDRLLAPLLSRAGFSNAYRIVVRAPHGRFSVPGGPPAPRG
ncbi:class I SAM-dependent methyltransferase [Streptomyces albireticuli]|uniref:Methyltransferase type 12 n=1 Tax=Streptomyces albireticuli TaxID=1940 RepID=A0A2A2D3I0_9ACTN|nr:class I SAM-dependent methyltransferase [Streptomyces albireticuli]MCD9144375.1 class I SAM-dependent methyltransferase [Streptomyces albireticuli]MCD9163562.1 class I SAM-dependent methyltransferase [Streptomyces albireticuli]MCD9193052.1 class I SAM-dependent methyltransferase [Streptomyces albireticuli]PAU46065.1 methyltransferase type 12 [Streptomyces albireticuli]